MVDLDLRMDYVFSLIRFDIYKEVYIFSFFFFFLENTLINTDVSLYKGIWRLESMCI